MTIQNPQISIIIPTLNEEEQLNRLLPYLNQNSSAANIKEILVVDGGSTDGTLEITSYFGAIALRAPKGRAKQMNFAAKRAKGQILYFLHADTFPPKSFDEHIIKAIVEGHETGCFRLQFDSSSYFLKFFAHFSAINHKICRGGDQSLFVTKRLFSKLSGYNEAYRIYEDSEFIGRLYKRTKFKVLPQRVVTSARKYKKYGIVRLQYYFGVIHLKNIFGAGPDQLYAYYCDKVMP